MNIALDNNTYGIAASYADLHNISVTDAIKAGLLLLTGKSKQQKLKQNIRPISELHPSVQALIGIARKKVNLKSRILMGKKLLRNT